MFSFADLDKHEEFSKCFRISHQSCSIKKGVLKNFAKFTGKQLCQSFFNNVAGSRPPTLLKKRLWHRCFPVNFAKFISKHFLQNTSGRLLQMFCLLKLFHYSVDCAQLVNRNKHLVKESTSWNRNFCGVNETP